MADTTSTPDTDNQNPEQDSDSYAAVMQSVQKIEGQLKSLEQKSVYEPRWAFANGAIFIVFTLIVVFVLRGLLSKGKEPKALLRIFILPIIIAAAVFLAILGYDDKQLAPVLGLLGTLAGYIMGRAEESALTKDHLSVGTSPSKSEDSSTSSAD